MSDPAQEQANSGGENYQAARDIIVQGVSLEQARQVALDVFRENFYELRDLAQETAVGRAEKVTNEYLDRLFRERPESVTNLSDPDVQRSLITAQTEFACSGEPDLESLLVDLLVDRTSTTERDMKTLALNEAIAVAPRLTQAQRSTLASVFFLKNTGRTELVETETFNGDMVRVLSAIGGQVLEKRSEFQYLVAVGVGSTNSLQSFKFGELLRYAAPGQFTRGFSREELDSYSDAVTLSGDRTIFIPALRDHSKLQVNAYSKLGIARAHSGHSSAIINQLESLMDLGLMADTEIAEEFSAMSPEIADFIARWDAGAAGSFDLTATGIAIGHAYWQRATGINADLSIWL